MHFVISNTAQVRHSQCAKTCAILSLAIEGKTFVV